MGIQEHRKVAFMHNLGHQVKTNSLEVVLIGVLLIGALLIGTGLGWLLIGQRRPASTRISDGRSLDERFDELARDGVRK
jgi:hypothetical protein